MPKKEPWVQPDASDASAQPTDQATDPSEPDRALQDALRRIAELESQVASANDAMLRAIADLQNTKRRSAQEAALAREAAGRQIAATLLPVLDNFERTLAAVKAGAKPEAVVEGVAIIDKMLRDVLESHRVVPILALGLPFDPDWHEAIATEPSEHEAGLVIAEFERGYRIGERVLRPSKVKVSKGTSS